MRILIIGSNGFIAKNLIDNLKRNNDYELLLHNSSNTLDELREKIFISDIIYHCAGVNRSEDSKKFEKVNSGLTKDICEFLKNKKTFTKVIYISTIQALLKNIYGQSKKLGEDHLIEISKSKLLDVKICRCPNVFGKWSKPNYNSVVATYCYNIARNIEISISDPDRELNLIYIDDLVENLKSVIKKNTSEIFFEVSPLHKITLAKLAKTIESFRQSRKDLILDETGKGLKRALFATYNSYLSPNLFSYEVPFYEDERGKFSEFIKFQACGQVSFFTSKPGEIRGSHYHHTKAEKFFVVSGKASFRFKDVITNELYEETISEEDKKIIETVPGWAHEVINIGKKDLIVILWANEIFDRKKPDTYSFNLKE